MPSRDPSADRARHAARDRSAERGRPLGGEPRERLQAAGSTERLRAAVNTTAFPPRDQRAASPGRALLEVQQHLQSYAAKESAGERSGWGGSGEGAGSLIAAAPSPQQQQQQRARVPPTGDHYADASAEIADIDSRLHSLQQFLKSAKASSGLPAPVPAAL